MYMYQTIVEFQLWYCCTLFSTLYILRYTRNVFRISSKQPAFLVLLLVRVHLWDLSGSTEYLDVRNELYGGTDAIFLVYDVTNSSSFADLDTWIRELIKYGSPNVDICVVANKVSLDVHIFH